MTSLRYKIVEGILRAVKYRDNMLKDIKSHNARHCKPPQKVAARYERQRFDGQDVWVCRPKANASTPAKAYVHIHGGGFVYGLQPMHYVSLCELSDASGAVVILPDYPLPPSASPKQIADWSLAQYLSITAQYGAENVTLGGCSAGANLALVVSQLLSHRGHTQPAAMQLWSPWIDLYTDRELSPAQNNEALITADALIPARAYYAQGRDLQDPLISPAFMDVDDLPPVHIITGQKDVLFTDIDIFAQRLKAAGKLTSYKVEPEFGHYWMFYPVPDRRPTLAYLAGLLKTQLTA